MSRFRSWSQKIRLGFRWLRQKIKRHRVITTIIIFVGMGIFIRAAYLNNWGWAGFNAVSSRTWQIEMPKTPSGTTILQIEEQQQAKTLWDWLNLLGVLAIPVVVAVGAAWYTAQQEKVSKWENKDNQCETALQEYIDKMSELLLHGKLRDSAEKDEVRKIVRVRTLTILPRLDAARKRSVFQFLHESGLINKDASIIDLLGADLSGANLRMADLRGSDLHGVNLRVADLRVADLRVADLSGAFLYSAILRRADLSGADLSGAILSGANLRQANLRGINLSGAILGGADLSEADLSEADLTGANLSGSHPDGANQREAILRGAMLSEAEVNVYNLNLGGADLSGADLSGANLSGAKVAVEQLDKAKSLQGATMHNGLRRS